MSIRTAQKELTRQRILDAVLDLVAEGALTEVSVPDVARRSGASVATIYRYFPTKDALFQAAAEEPASARRPATCPTARSVGGPSTSASCGRRSPRTCRCCATSSRRTPGREMRAARSRLAAVVRRRRREPRHRPASDAGRRLVRLALLLTSTLAFVDLHDRQGVDAETAAADVTWAVDRARSRDEEEEHDATRLGGAGAGANGLGSPTTSTARSPPSTSGSSTATFDAGMAANCGPSACRPRTITLRTVHGYPFLHPVPLSGPDVSRTPPRAADLAARPGRTGVPALRNGRGRCARASVRGATSPVATSRRNGPRRSPRTKRSPRSTRRASDDGARRATSRRARRTRSRATGATSSCTPPTCSRSGSTSPRASELGIDAARRARPRRRRHRRPRRASRPDARLRAVHRRWLRPRPAPAVRVRDGGRGQRRDRPLAAPQFASGTRASTISSPTRTASTSTSCSPTPRRAPGPRRQRARLRRVADRSAAARVPGGRRRAWAPTRRRGDGARARRRARGPGGARRRRARTPRRGTAALDRRRRARPARADERHPARRVPRRRWRRCSTRSCCCATWASGPPASELEGTGIGTRVGDRHRPGRRPTPTTRSSRLEPGDVIVATVTSPAFNAVLPLASALVVEHGGLMSHAALVARELGIPAIVGVRGRDEQRRRRRAHPGRRRHGRVVLLGVRRSVEALPPTPDRPGSADLLRPRGVRRKLRTWRTFGVARPGLRTSRFWRRCWARPRSGVPTSRHRPATRCSPIRATRCTSRDGRGKATMDSLPNRMDRWARPGIGPTPRRATATASSRRTSRNCRSPSSLASHEGIGRRLLVDLIAASVAQGYPALSLSVSADNPARGLYESVGFVPVEKRGTSWTMVRHAAQST